MVVNEKINGSEEYIIDVGKTKARKINIKVSGKLANGTVVTDKKKFRIKDIPSPVGTLRAEDGNIKTSRRVIENAAIGAIIPDFDFNLHVEVKGFKFKVDEQPPISVTGNRLNSEAKIALEKAKKGSTVTIFDIKTILKRILIID
ncbi:GldM-like protein [Aquimarina sp. MAR_2010_214]|uniref:GldM family protein n=1 Tax=Aquimarina sp. MAR_2010_214 TaxID=1250026 RepID=UPI000CC0B8AF|nr:GldM family protein [Aquimarina sp. MAR_2010_214]PKV48046.1 GldM-like protein [Aquimarina sp. MAR_2010_214]